MPLETVMLSFHPTAETRLVITCIAWTALSLNLSLVSLHSQADFGSRDVVCHATAMIEHRRLALALREWRWNHCWDGLAVHERRKRKFRLIVWNYLLENVPYMQGGGLGGSAHVHTAKLVQCSVVQYTARRHRDKISNPGWIVNPWTTGT